jgi:hypothetical protein
MNMNLHFNAAPFPPLCARYEGGENDQRLLAVWTFVSGLIGGGENSHTISKDIARLYDYKGILVVGLRSTLPDHVMALFRRAWEEVGCEMAENVEFLHVSTDEWKEHWGSRRFKSDWVP